MDPETLTPAISHFHIYWNAKNALDWVLFDSYDDAVVGALAIASLREPFSIRECLGTCLLPRQKD